jgi:hypothetical protein
MGFKEFYDKSARSILQGVSMDALGLEAMNQPVVENEFKIN